MDESAEWHMALTAEEMKHWTISQGCKARVLLDGYAMVRVLSVCNMSITMIGS